MKPRVLNIIYLQDRFCKKGISDSAQSVAPSEAEACLMSLNSVRTAKSHSSLQSCLGK
jgi:hypothetical protein